MGVLEARQEANRRFVAERNERLEREQAALAAQQAEAEAKLASKDRDERRETARRDARLGYLARVKPLEPTAIAANSAQAAFDATLADPAATVEKLFLGFSAMQSTKAIHAVLRGTIETYQFVATHPGQPLPTRYRNSSPQPTFADVLDQVVAARAAASASAAVVPADVFAKADAEGEKAARAVEQ